MAKFLHEFMCYGDSTEKHDNGWWEIDGDYLYNTAGGRHSYIPKADDIIAEADDITGLDWSHLIKDDCPTGWVDLDGKFYGCEVEAHSAVARLYFKSDEKELEELGWVKIFRSFNDKSLTFYCENRNMNKQQEDCLIESGLLEKKWGRNNG
jgi:hypothetical protein